MGLRSDLSGIIPDTCIQHVPEGYEILGDIAIIVIPPSLLNYKEAIIAALLNRRPGLKTILNKSGRYQGIKRIPRFEIIYGLNTVTEVREFGFRYQLDLLEVYFTTKMASERRRIADLIRPGESVLVPFAGIGPYAVPAAARGAKVIAVEISRPACKWMTLNGSVNNVRQNLEIIQADALKTSIFLNRTFSRIIIPTPYGLLQEPSLYMTQLENHGVLHWITFCNKTQIEKSIRDISKKGYQVLRWHQCGNVAPSVSRWILDIFKP